VWVPVRVASDNSTANATATRCASAQQHSTTDQHGEAPTDASESHLVRLPAIKECVRRAGQHVIEGALMPALTFYAVLEGVGLRWALIACLLWAYTVIGLRLVRGNRVPGVLLVSAGLITARTAIALAANSTFVYFLQPSVGNICIAVLFLASLLPGKPLVRRLADDFCSLPASLDNHPRVATFFSRLTILWALICAANGVTTLMLLLHQSIGEMLALRPVVSYGLIIAGTTVSYLWFRKTLHAEGLRIVFGS